MTAPGQDSSPRSHVRGFSVVGVLAILGGAAGLAWIVIRAIEHGRDATHAIATAGAPAWWGAGSIPFLGILTAIALLPLLPITRHWWEHNRNRLIVSLIAGGLTLLY